MKTNRRESQVLAGIIAYLQSRGDCFFWRQNTSAGVAPSGQFMRSNMRGVADILCILSPSGTMFDARFIAIEVKREKGGSQSDDQKRFEQNIVNHGAYYLLARSVEDVEHELGPVVNRIPWVRSARVVPR